MVGFTFAHICTPPWFAPNRASWMMECLCATVRTQHLSINMGCSCHLMLLCSWHRECKRTQQTAAFILLMCATNACSCECLHTRQVPSRLSNLSFPADFSRGFVSRNCSRPTVDCMKYLSLLEHRKRSFLSYLPPSSGVAGFWSNKALNKGVFRL